MGDWGLQALGDMGWGPWAREKLAALGRAARNAQVPNRAEVAAAIKSGKYKTGRAVEAVKELGRRTSRQFDAAKEGYQAVQQGLDRMKR